jgi:hypothetical protein
MRDPSDLLAVCVFREETSRVKSVNSMREKGGLNSHSLFKIPSFHTRSLTQALLLSCSYVHTSSRRRISALESIALRINTFIFHPPLNADLR